MEPRHVITQVVGTAAALVLGRWGWRELRRDWHERRRLPLVTGPFMGGRTVLATVGVVAALVPLMFAIMKLELIPRQSVALFIATLAWVAGAFVFALLGLTTMMARSAAKGWITVVGADTLRVEAAGESATLRLRPGAARLSFIISGGGGPQYVQLDLEDEQGTTAHIWGMVGLRDLKLVSPGRLAQPQGLMSATSMGPLCRWLAPYLADACR